MDLQPGDVFCVHGNMGLVSAGIRMVEKIWSKDNEATYGHSGIITDHAGNTLEALWTVKESNISQYKGQKVIIARPTHTLSGKGITEGQKRLAIAAIKAKHLGQYYPIYRLGMHLVRPLAKIRTFGRLVCSEVTAKNLHLLQVRHSQYEGTNPDMLADEWKHWRNFEIVHEGVL